MEKSMNIVVIGGGEPGKFGNDFCLRARSEGHIVYILSHKDYNNQDPYHHYTDFKQSDLVVDAFRQLTRGIDNIDLFVFNTSSGTYPNLETDFKSTSSVNIDRYNLGIYYSVALPHILCIEAFKKMSKGSRFVFLSSKMGMEFRRTHYTEMAGYAGAKAFQIHLMMSLSHHNNVGAIGTTVCPHFPYNEPHNYPVVFEKVYNYILTFNKNANVEFISHIKNFHIID
jgi:NAD(P)-dependent dehydrogenase (short-subunit alcohol dehydrogenase family)